MTGAWQEALMLLHARGWNGELIDEACTALLEACSEGELKGRQVGELSPTEARRVLDEPAEDAEIDALCAVAGLHDRADAAGEALRAALRDLDAFADSLGER
jgi:hypothetical protein